MEGKQVARNTLIQATMVAMVVLFVMLLLHAAEIFLVVFGGILFAVLFHGVASWLSKKSGLSQRWTLPVALIVPMLILGGGGWLIAPDVASQARELADRIPTVLSELEQQVREYKRVDQLLDNKDQAQEILPDGSSAVGILTGIFSSAFSALANLVIALFIGLFLVVSPHMYINGLIRLVPLGKRSRAREVMNKTGSALESWLVAKIAEMLVIGVLTTIGLWFIGIDLALVLGVIAAFLSFIPNIGPILALIPAALIGLISGVDKFIYVVFLYVGVQTFESYLLTPMLQQHMVNLPPALVISAQVLFGFIAGILGIILATPLLAAAMVMINMWYIEDLLGDRAQGN